jgi:hypothetical protein
MALRLAAIGDAVVDLAVAVMIAGLRMLAWPAQRPAWWKCALRYQTSFF